VRAAAERDLTPALIVCDDGSVPADARWLELRVQADNAARELTTTTLLPRLVRHLTATGVGDSGVDVIDLGSGTGANQRWLASRLPFAQQWTLIDRDQALQRHRPVAPRTRLLTADVGILASVLDGPSARLVTCSALLDVLTIEQLTAIGSALAAARHPALFSLTVTGVIEVSPPDPFDAHLIRAFNNHQRRGGRAGPAAVDVLARSFRDAGYALWMTETPWLLDWHSDGDFVRWFLDDRVAAAVAQDPTLRSAGVEWLARRLAQLAEQTLEIRVGHRDLLVLPRSCSG
jgi:hypothetical protein